MQTGFSYDCTPRYVHLCALSISHCTGKERDAESGLDYFGARYYASNMGRWMSPDWSAKEEPVPYAKLGDPQTLNLYSYVQNNPLSQLDDDGHETLHPGDGWDPRHDPERQTQGRPMTTGEKVAFGSGVAAVATLGVSGELEAGAAALWALGSRALTAATSICIAACPAVTSHLNDAAGGFNTSGTAASVEGKLSNYLLNAEHATGGSKASWFDQALGFNKSNMGDLASQIKFDPKTAVQTGVNDFGTLYNQSINIAGANGRVIPVTFAWIKLNGTNAVNLVTAIPTKK